MSGETGERADTLVIGGGIAGLQSALDLAEQGFKVVVVERSSSIGGKMIALSKVFPTLDCASCITTPKMAAAAHHENITLLTYSEVLKVEEEGEGFCARVLKKPRYVIEDKCIGCRQCEYACSVEVPDPFEGSFGTHRAIYVPFSTAIPQVAVLEPEHCMLCGKCVRVCPTDAVVLDQKPEELDLHVRTVIVATGFELTALDRKPEYQGERLTNVISPLEMERLLAPHGPYGRVLRPSDGKVPDSIAYVLCAGSRDHTIGVPYCSRVCCMYSTKQAMLLSGAVPLADITVYYMDIRAFGKGFETFYENAKAMGIEYIKGKVARIDEGPDGAAVVRFERIDGSGQVEERAHDLVVLASGILPACAPGPGLPVKADEDGFVHQPDPTVDPASTGREGIIVCGVACGPKDIVDTIAEAGAAAMSATRVMRRKKADMATAAGEAVAAGKSATGGEG